jgi:predicted acetyltransferase
VDVTGDQSQAPRTSERLPTAGHQGIEVVAATPDARPVVERLTQFYEYDVSDFEEEDLDPDGVYRIMDLDALWRPGRHVFLVWVEGRLAGFAFVARHQAYIGEGDTWLMDEFFILRRYRRLGVGEHVARALFDRFGACWEVATTHRNTVAQTFWRHVIDRYTNGTYREVAAGCEHWPGPIWTFDAARRSAATR